MIMNTYDRKRPYVLDVFQVQGGNQRDYFLKSSVQHPMKGESSFPMVAMPGLHPLVPEEEAEQIASGKMKPTDMGSGYRLFFNVRRGSAEAGGTVDYTVKEPWIPRKKIKHYESRPSLCPFKFHGEGTSYPEEPPVGVRHHVVGQAGQEAFFFESPDTFESVCDVPPDTEYETWKQSPHLMLRHKVEDPREESIFVVVHEPWSGEAKIRQATQVPCANPELLAVQIDFGDRKDLVFISKSGTEQGGEAAGVRFSGRIGVHSQQGDQEEKFLMGGSLLQRGGRPLSQPVPEVRAEIVKSYRRWHGDKTDGFLVRYAGGLPTGDDLVGAGVYVNNPGRVTNVTVKDFVERSDRMHCAWMHMMAKDIQDPEIQLQAAIDSHNNGQIARWTPKKEAADAVRARLARVGGDWAFVVAGVESHGGDAYLVHTTEDHGLDIVGDEAEEFAHPRRRIEGTSGLVIYPMSCSQRAPTVSPPGGAFMEPTAVTLTIENPVDFYNQTQIWYAIAATGGQAEPVWRKNGAPVVPEEFQGEGFSLGAQQAAAAAAVEWILYREPFVLDKNTSLLVKGVNPKCIATQCPEPYHFAIAEAPTRRRGTLLHSGLEREVKRCSFDAKMHSTEADQIHGRVYYGTIAQLKERGAIQTMETVVGPDIVPDVDVKDAVDLSTRRNWQSETTFRGFLEVPASGVYAIFFRPHPDGELSLNGKKYVWGRYQSCTPMPYAFDVPLVQGWTHIEVIYRLCDTRGRNGKPHLDLEWVRPDGVRETIPRCRFWHHGDEGTSQFN